MSELALVASIGSCNVPFSNHFPIIVRSFSSHFPVIFRLFSGHFQIIVQSFSDDFPDTERHRSFELGGGGRGRGSRVRTVDAPNNKKTRIYEDHDVVDDEDDYVRDDEEG